MSFPKFSPSKAVARDWARYKRNVKAACFWGLLLTVLALVAALFVSAGGRLPSLPNRTATAATATPTVPLPTCDGWSDRPCTPATTTSDDPVERASGLARISGDVKKVAGTKNIPTHCEARTSGDGRWLPDPACAPGAVSTRVTASNIRTTICRTGYTKTVRPATSITGPIKVKLLAAYGYAAGSEAELDHVVPLTLGGANSVSNLAPQPGPIPNAKDTVELRLAQAVCAGRVTLAEAQRRVATDWTTALAGIMEALESAPAPVDMDTDDTP